jgi:hypothetical protein
MDWNSWFCGKCGDGGELVECDGICLRSFHLACLPDRERPPPSEPDDTPWCAHAFVVT